MSRILTALLLAAAVCRPVAAQLIPSYGEDRAGTSGFQFLKIASDPRGAALGGTAVATASDASALYWNPALASRAGDTAVGASTLQYVADIQMNYAAGIQKLGPYTVGVHVQTLDSGDMTVTDEFSGPGGTGQSFAYRGLAAGVTLSQRLTDQFAYGVTAKVARESAADVASQTALLDLGVHYQVGLTGAAIGVAIRNFGLNGGLSGALGRNTIDQGTVTEEDFDEIVPPTLFLLGVSYAPLRAGAHDLTVSGQLTSFNDNAEQFNVGAEYVWSDLLAVRTGYAFGNEEATVPAFGFGVFVPGLGTRQIRADYAFARFERLGSTHRIGVNVNF